MTAVREQYTESIKQGQEAVRGAVDGWTRTVQDALGKLPVTEPAEAVDQFYAVTARLLEVQRDFAQRLVGVATSFTDTVRSEAGKAAASAKSTTL